MAVGSRDYAGAGFPMTKGGRSVSGRQALRNYSGTERAGSYLGYGPADVASRSQPSRPWGTAFGGAAAIPPLESVMPSAGTVDYAHKLGQSVIVWGALVVFAILMIDRRRRPALLRRLASHHVA